MMNAARAAATNAMLPMKRLLAELLTGDLSTLEQEVALAIIRAAKNPEVVALSKNLGIDPVVLVIGLLARSASASNRSAARIAKAVLGTRDIPRADEILNQINCT